MAWNPLKKRRNRLSSFWRILFHRISVTHHRDAGGNWTSYAYTTNDLVSAVTDALNQVTSYTYNDRGQITNVTNADGSTRSMAYDSYGNKTSEVDELGHVTSWTYDEFNRVVVLCT